MIFIGIIVIIILLVVVDTNSKVAEIKKVVDNEIKKSDNWQFAKV